MRNLRGFLPWVVFSLVFAAGWQWAACAALLVALVLLVAGRRAGLGLDAQILDVGMVSFFGILSVLALSDPGSPLRAWASPLGSAWLAATAAISLAIGRPFTHGIARSRVPAEVARSAAFLRTNQVITAIWTAGFAVAAVAGGICVAAHGGPALQTLGPIVGYGGAGVATWRYSVRARSRRIASPPELRSSTHEIAR
ncbi:hypothetical protein [Amycolatopsis sp. NPDC021455]|uniref:hypothetical protein n=1 Tax=Amycolatopsis sp. NPDC021455 TaxID=3154901 RepID=UPI0033CEFB15